jgi:hypothetical protein
MITRSDRFAARFALLALGAVGAVGAPSRARADEPALDPLRERFRGGMESYKAGHYADAILVWEGIYRELGSEAGYRLAFNIGRAYDAYGDSTHAAERYEAYLAAVEKRRARGEALEANVERQEAEARERLAALAATSGRIRVTAAPERPVVVQIDRGAPRLAGFVAYVAPGTHTVTFAPGKDETRRDVELKEGELVELAPPPPPPTTPVTPSSPPAVAPPPAAHAPEATQWETRRERPFSPVVLWVAGGVTVLSIAAPIVTYANALSTKSDYDSATSDADKRRLSGEYDAEKSTAYASLAVPAACAAITGGLVVWWLAGTKEMRVPLVPQATVGRGGATLGVTGSF